MPTTLFSYLRDLPAQFLPRPTPIHLRGLSTAYFPVNQLWREVHSEANLEQAFGWLCEQNAEAHHNHDVWDYRRQWPERKAVLHDLLLHGEFAFQPVRIVEVRNERGEIERREVRCAEDRLVIRALAQVLQPVHRHGCRHAAPISQVYAVLQALRVKTHPDKTFLGKVAKGFDFLGFHCCPTGLRVSDAALSRRDQKLARLYEQGADKKRIALYLALWLGWAGAASGAGIGDALMKGPDGACGPYGPAASRCERGATELIVKCNRFMQAGEPKKAGEILRGVVIVLTAFGAEKLPGCPTWLSADPIDPRANAACAATVCTGFGTLLWCEASAPNAGPTWNHERCPGLRL